MSADSAALRRRLVDQLASHIELSDPVREAFLAVPRELFLARHAAEHGLESAYRDDAIVTKTNASGAATSSSSQPSMMALMLECLRLEPGQRVLEIGAGTGYNAALMKRIVGEDGRVVSVEVDAETAESARGALRAAAAEVEVVTGDGREGWAAGAPYDRIVVTASTSSVYPAWWRQLAEGGRLEAPLHLAEGLQPVVTFRREGERLVSTDVLSGSFMTLRSPEGEALTPEEPSLTVADARGRRGVGLRLGGGALRSMSTDARRRLLRLLLDEPRARLRCPDAPFFSLALYLSLTIPEGRLLSLWPPFGIGLTTRDGSGAALAIAGPRDRGRPALAELRAYGSPDAEADLTARIRRWEELGKPDERALAITADFRDEDAPRLARRWLSVRAER